MTESPMDRMWKVMKDNCLQVVSEHDHLLCSICHGLMINACISNCMCTFCKLCLETALENETTNCNGEGAECRRQSLILNQNVFPDNSANIKISKLKALCPNSECGCEIDLGQMLEHLRVCNGSINECPFVKLGCNEIPSSEEHLSMHLESRILGHSLLLVEVIENLRNELNLVQMELKETKSMLEKINEDFEYRLAEESQKNKATMKELQKRINKIEKQSRKEDRNNDTSIERNAGKRSTELQKPHARLSIGYISWHVKHFTEKSRRAKEEGLLSTNSDPFLSHKGGYTFRLVMYPNGCSNGKGTHLYIGFHLMKGDFDDKLEWPYKGSITISLVDQITGEYKFTKKYYHDHEVQDNHYLFDKPVQRNNHSFGDLKLVEFGVLFQHHSLVMDDSLMVYCFVDPTNQGI